jgi:hypothetical protein
MTTNLERQDLLMLVVVLVVLMLVLVAGVVSLEAVATMLVVMVVDQVRPETQVPVATQARQVQKDRMVVQEILALQDQLDP